MSKQQKTRIGERLRSKRVDAGLTQKQLAEKLNITQATISNWENGKVEPNDNDLKQLAGIIGRIYKPRPNAPTESEENDISDADVSAFGVWLSKTRLKKQLSVPELASQAHVTPPTIYALECGRIVNPRESTRKKIEDALGEKVSKDVTMEIKRDSDIEIYGSLVGFNPHDAEDIPTEPGVYVLYDISERPIYVGQGNNISKRLKDHEQKFWFKRPIVETAAYVKIQDEQTRRSIETLLIRFLKSNAVLNKQNVER